jgi:hypothetical protein
MTDYEIKNIIKIWVNECIKEMKLENDNWIVTCIHDCHGVMSMNQYSMTKLYPTREMRETYGRHGEIIINLVPFEMQYREVGQHKEHTIKKNIKRHLLYEFQEAAHYDYLLHQDIVPFEYIHSVLSYNGNVYRDYIKTIKKYCNKTVDSRMINSSCGYLEAFLLNNYKMIMER